MPVVAITSLADPRIADYANMRDAELAQRLDPADASAHRGLFIAEGELVVERLLDSSYRTRSVLLTPTRLEAMRARLDKLPAETPIYVAEPPVLNEIVGFNMHRGLLAIGERRTASTGHPLAEILSLKGPLVLLEDLTNHDNLGGIFRNAAALGGPGCAVLLSPRCADPLYRKSLRVSMGHVLSVPFARSMSLADDLASLRAAGFKLIALTPSATAIDLETAAASLTGERLCLLLGAEGPGLSKEALSLADAHVRIGMRPLGSGVTIDSLNVGMAAGIALYRLGRG